MYSLGTTTFQKAFIKYIPQNNFGYSNEYV